MSDYSDSADKTDEKPQKPDWKLIAFSVLLSHHGIATRPSDLKAKLGHPEFVETADLLSLSSSHFKLRCRSIKLRSNKSAKFKLKILKKVQTPFLIESLSQGLVLITDVEPASFTYHNLDTGQKDILSFAEARQQFGTMAYSLTPIFQKDEDHFSLFWIFHKVLSKRSAFIQTLLSSFFIQIFALVTPLFTMVIIDKIFSATSNAASTLQVLLIALVAIAIFDFIIGLARKSLLSNVMNEVDITLMRRLFGKLTHLPMSYFHGKQTGETVSRMKDVEGIRSFMSSTALTSFIDLPFALIFLGVMSFYSTLLTVIVIISIAVSFLIYAFVGPFLKKRLQTGQEQNSDTQSFLIESVAGVETIKATAAEERLQRSWGQQIAAQTEFSQKTDFMTNSIGQLGQMINKITVAITLLLGAKLVISGDMTPGQLIAFNMLVGRVSAPAQRIGSMLQAAQQFFTSIKRVEEIYNAKPEPAYLETRSSLPDIKGAIKFDHVSFSYRNDGPSTLENISFEIQPGEIVGIVGSSGSGKSTLLRLAQRLAVPTSGSVFIDNINISQIDPTWLRSQIGIVLQDNFLFNLSVKENITFSDPTIPFDKVVEAARLAGAEDFIAALPQGFDTLLGERGEILSVGQRQRIAIARALVNDPQILIFDEATSALDYESERLVQSNMQAITEGRTVFLVAHRLATLRIANRIMTIEGGRLIENGTPKELLKNKGRFAQLLAMQTSANVSQASQNEYENLTHAKANAQSVKAIDLPKRSSNVAA